MFKQLTFFLSDKIQKLNEEDLPPLKSRLVRIVKISMIIVRDFFNDRCVVRASSLTYYTLLALVPLSAVVFAVLKRSGVQNIYAASLLNKILLNPEVTETVISYVNSTDVSALGIFGALTLFLTSVVLLNNIEKSFGDIWNIQEKRHLFKKLTYYLLGIFIIPLIATVGLSAALSFIKKTIPFSWNILPYIITFTGFTLIYLYFPNVKVKLKAAASGAASTTILWHLAQRTYIYWSRSIAKINIIYGGFSQIVLAFIWIYISWLIILAGTEISFAIQNYKSIERKEKLKNNNITDRERHIILILSCIYKNFSKNSSGVNKFSAQNISNKTSVPLKEVKNILSELTSMRILSVIHKEDTLFYKIN
ncbi:MAG: YihY/virulence factor BrkB family protein [Elusimicrobia bacterium]|jgi:membrane protein|nr:YihY/virulence factor BrkB family protein [Elusimicrobiota bacterium]